MDMAAALLRMTAKNTATYQRVCACGVLLRGSREVKRSEKGGAEERLPHITFAESVVCYAVTSRRGQNGGFGCAVCGCGLNGNEDRKPQTNVMLRCSFATQ